MMANKINTSLKTYAAKLKIYSHLSFDFVNTFSIMKSPLKINLRYSINYVEKAKVTKIFENMICAFEDHVNFPRTFIICQTNKLVVNLKTFNLRILFY